MTISTFGEAMLRLSVPSGERLSTALALDVHVAGAESNVAYALSRVGVPAAWSSVLPANPLGERVATELRAGGVDLDAVAWSAEGRLGVYFAELAVAPRSTSVVYDRAASAFAVARADSLDWDLVCRGKRLHVSGISFAVSESAAALAREGLAQAKQRGMTTSFDVNLRRRMIEPAALADAVRAASSDIDVLLCKRSDATALFSADDSALATARRLREELAIETVVVTDGLAGAAAVGPEGPLERPVIPVEAVVDPVGGGDAFAAGVLWGLLDGSLAEGVERGLAMAALKLTLRGDLFQFGREDVEALRAGGPATVLR